MDVLTKVKNNKVLVENFFYVSILQVFLLLAPLITYPYLVRILGMELYGMVITAQVLASYASILIDFGSNSVCAKHVSLNRDNKDKLSEIISSVLVARVALWGVCFVIYSTIVMLLPAYREYWVLFFLTYGLTLNDVLFPQFFFQGIEQMKYSTIVNVLFKLIFIVLVFLVVNSSEDYLWVPILYTIGYMAGGIFALWIIFSKMKIRFIIPTRQQIGMYVKDSLPLLGTDLICTIKDKLNYLLLGSFSGMANVVVYDLGMKIYGLASKPAGIINIVFFPRSAKTKNIKQFNQVLCGIVLLDLVIIGLVNIFLPYIVEFFLHEQVELLPLRLFTLAPLFSTTSAFIISNMCIAYGYSRYALYSICVTTAGYIAILITFYFTHFLSNLYAFVLLAVISYFIEFLYRVFLYRKVINKEKQNHI